MRPWLPMLILGVALAAMAGLAMLRPRTRPAERPAGSAVVRTVPPAPAPTMAPRRRAPAPKPADPATQASALHDSNIRDLVRHARIAARRRDDATRTAMLAGLRRDRARARELIREEQALARDPEDVTALRGLLEELN